MKKCRYSCGMGSILFSPYTPARAWPMSRSLMSVAKIFTGRSRSAWRMTFCRARAMLYGSSPVAQPGTQMRTCSSPCFSSTIRGRMTSVSAWKVSASRKNSVTMMRMS